MHQLSLAIPSSNSDNEAYEYSTYMSLYEELKELAEYVI